MNQYHNHFLAKKVESLFLFAFQILNNDVIEAICHFLSIFRNISSLKLAFKRTKSSCIRNLTNRLNSLAIQLPKLKYITLGYYHSGCRCLYSLIYFMKIQTVESIEIITDNIIEYDQELLHEIESVPQFSVKKLKIISIYQLQKKTLFKYIANKLSNLTELSISLNILFKSWKKIASLKKLQVLNVEEVLYEDLREDLYETFFDIIFKGNVAKVVNFYSENPMNHIHCNISGTKH